MPLQPLPRLFALHRRGAHTLIGLLVLISAAALLPRAVHAQGIAATAANDIAVDARDALRRKDGLRLGLLRLRALDQQHPLAQWIDYWELANRLPLSQQSDLDAFYARWSDTYVEDRLRNDWLLELGKRRDWANFTRDVARFRMNDDREVSCYTLLAEQLAAAPATSAFKDSALAAWTAQRELDDGCHQLATTLVEARVFGPDDVWAKVRLAAEGNRARAGRAAAALVAPALAAQAAQAFEQPALYLNAGATTGTRANAELAAIALVRMAASDHDVAAAQWRERWQRRLPADLSAWVASQIARNAALKLAPDAATLYATAWSEAERSNVAPTWSDETLAWNVRAALRASNGAARWSAVRRAIDHMSAAEQRDPAWRYWGARAQRETAAPGAAGDRQLQQALATLQTLAGELHFYGKLAAEDLGQTWTLPPQPDAISVEERAVARTQPGLTRALQLIALGLRSEGVREWNYSLRGMNDRALLAAADWACERQVWDRCINTSDRTRAEIDLLQRFPTPFRREVLAKSREIGLDPAYVYGLIRQESRFITDARSGVGASGLMQVMPATARWTAKKIGLPFTPEMITDRDTNLKIGTSYLKLVLDDFDGSQAMAAAAYNAGPGRPRRWREGATLEPAIWAENIPFNETRDYVKKVLSNATVYAAMLSEQLPLVLPSLKARLGAAIGPRDVAAPASDKELP